MYFVKLYGGGVCPPEVLSFDNYGEALRAAEQLVATSLDRVAVGDESGVRVW